MLISKHSPSIPVHHTAALRPVKTVDMMAGITNELHTAIAIMSPESGGALAAKEGAREGGSACSLTRKSKASLTTLPAELKNISELYLLSFSQARKQALAIRRQYAPHHTCEDFSTFSHSKVFYLTPIRSLHACHLYDREHPHHRDQAKKDDGKCRPHVPKPAARLHINSSRS